MLIHNASWNRSEITFASSTIAPVEATALRQACPVVNLFVTHDEGQQPDLLRIISLRIVRLPLRMQVVAGRHHIVRTHCQFLGKTVTEDIYIKLSFGVKLFFKDIPDLPRQLLGVVQLRQMSNVYDEPITLERRGNLQDG